MDKSLYVQVANKLLDQLKQGTSPWQQPWENTKQFSMPYNAQSGQRYKGINAVHLMLSGYSDPRWMTFKQAQASGISVKAREKGTMIQFVKTHQLVKSRDDSGKPLLDEKGEWITKSQQLNRPIISNAYVFNASQVKGIAPLIQESLSPLWTQHSRAEELIQACGAIVQHSSAAQACYSPKADLIRMPLREQFSSAQGYYATLLHELSHWSGHQSRLNRQEMLTGDSLSYAREELRAEISSIMLGDELKTGHDFSQHAAYIQSWVAILENTPFEIHSASRDAEAIFSFITSFEQNRLISNSEKLETIPQRELPYLSTGDEIAHKGNLYQVKGHLKAGLVRIEQQPSGINFALSPQDRLYEILLRNKQQPRFEEHKNTRITNKNK